MIDIRYPNITGADESAQLLQVKSYLHQLVDQLNIALRDVESTAVSVPAAKSASVAKAEKDNEVQNTFKSLKALIIKSADIVDAYYDEINTRLSSVYVARSDEYGDYTEIIEKLIQDTAGYSQELISYKAGIDSRVEGIEDQLIETDGYIKRGIIDYDNNGAPIIGIEIGQTNEENGKETFSQYARFTSDKLSFFDSGGNEVAYVGDETLHITNVEIKSEAGPATFRIGGFKDEARSDGSVVTRWEGV